MGLTISIQDFFLVDKLERDIVILLTNQQYYHCNDYFH